MALTFENMGKTIGLKQSRRAVREGRAKAAYVALDADSLITDPFVQACNEEGVPVTEVATMRELGEAAGIEIGAAVVAILR